MSEDVRDGRLLRGLRSRRTIVRHAVDTASLEGLDGLSFGRLATDLDVGKSSIQTLFATKEKLQLAVIEAAREAFEEAVVRPALAEPRGAERLRALVERWLAYAEQPLFPGGCFWAANLPEFDSRPGPVRDMLAGQQRAWRERIAAELRHSHGAGTTAGLDADLTAFQIDAVLTAANTAMRLGDDAAAAKVRRVLDSLLAPASGGG
nr:TetR/AcrR family transcriptional regulator [Streptomyces sp. NRRL S-350]